MNLGVVKRILKEDLAKNGDVPSWMDYLLQPLNEFIEKVGLALQNRLTFSENFLCKVVSQSFISGTVYQINPKLVSSQATLHVVGVVLMDPGGGTVDKWFWSRNSNGNLNVSITYSDVTSATATIYIFLGK